MAHTPSFGAEALSRQVPAERISPPGHHSTTTLLTLALKPTSIILVKWVSCPQPEDAVGFLCSPLFGMSLYLTSVTPSLHGCVGFPLAVLSGGSSLAAVQSPHSGGFSCGAQAPGLSGFSSCGSWTLECGFSSCGARAQLPQGLWDLPGPRVEPVFPALAGGFSTNEPPGKPHTSPSNAPYNLIIMFTCQ